MAKLYYVIELILQHIPILAPEGLKKLPNRDLYIEIYAYDL